MDLDHAVASEVRSIIHQACELLRHDPPARSAPKPVDARTQHVRAMAPRGLEQFAEELLADRTLSVDAIRERLLQKHLANHPHLARESAPCRVEWRDINDGDFIRALCGGGGSGLAGGMMAMPQARPLTLAEREQLRAASAIDFAAVTDEDLSRMLMG